MGSNKTERTDIKAEIRKLMHGYHLIWKVLVQYLVNTEQNVLWYRITSSEDVVSSYFRVLPLCFFSKKFHNAVQNLYEIASTKVLTKLESTRYRVVRQ